MSVSVVAAKASETSIVSSLSRTGADMAEQKTGSRSAATVAVRARMSNVVP